MQWLQPRPQSEWIAYDAASFMCMSKNVVCMSSHAHVLLHVTALCNCQVTRPNTCATDCAIMRPMGFHEGAKYRVKCEGMLSGLDFHFGDKDASANAMVGVRVRCST